ncbi:MAG: PilZ domain-containing protein [Planctomycetota bacterium]
MPRLKRSEESGKYIDTLRISDAEWRQLANDLDREAADANYAAEREFERVPYRNMVQAVCEIDHPGGNRVRFVVRTRDLSASGVGFFHGQYLHVGSRCSMFLTCANKGPQRLTGTVRRCEYITGRIHQIGIEFDQLIEPSDYLLYGGDP